jgi:hypothetical protein
MDIHSRGNVLMQIKKSIIAMQTVSAWDAMFNPH